MIHRKPPFSWTLRKLVWNSISILIFRFKKAKRIPLPPQAPAPLTAVPLNTRIPGVQIDNIMMANRIPPGESSLIMYYSFSLRIWLSHKFPPLMRGLPQISENIDEAIQYAYGRAYRALFDAPKRPAEFETEGMPDLGQLATSSPYACFLQKDEEGHLVWDFRDLADHETFPGLRPLGTRVFFELNAKERRLEANRIECILGDLTPEHDLWHEGLRTAMCAASTQVSMVNHFNWVHLACGGPFSIATRNHLYDSHPICRLMWPHMFGTQNSNYLVTKGQMLQGGDFDTVFSFTHEGMCDLFARTYDGYRATVTVPEMDWRDRGLSKDAFDTPVQDNLESLYKVMRDHTARYIEAYYPDDKSVAEDEALNAWIRALEDTIPNGIAGITGGELTRTSLADLTAGFIYMASVQHEILGSCMWNYQMWVDKNPVRIHTNGKRVPIDVFQRLVNANFNLNVDRAKLMQDLSYFALDARGEAAFLAFYEDLKQLEYELAKKDYACWRVTPSMLEANINA